MSKSFRLFTCQACGAKHAKWVGCCDGCGSWNTITEEAVSQHTYGAGKAVKGVASTFTSLDAMLPEIPRWQSQNQEFDRVCGGGLVPGSVVLLGGDPGIGKSTLLLQIVGRLAKNISVAYISGEESVDQIQRRAKRLGVQAAQVMLASETSVENILASLKGAPNVGVVVIDSIQTVFSDSIESAPGTVSQVRVCAHHLIQYAKSRNVVVIFVGHVTKEGTIAGPKVLEHMVDTVIYFEGEKGHQYRLLRTIKNRFGPANEIGVFEMTSAGLVEVANPSGLFLLSRDEPVSGTSVFAGIEGSRSVLMEMQALVVPCPYGTPRRAVVGWDLNRLHMLLAVLESRCGLSLGNKDVFLSIAGGLKMTEPASDLAVMAAILSAVSDVPSPPQSVFWGEIGLSGDVRFVHGVEQRLKESEKLGFRNFYTPSQDSGVENNPEIQIHPITHVRDLLSLFLKH